MLDALKICAKYLNPKVKKHILLAMDKKIFAQLKKSFRLAQECQKFVLFKEVHFLQDLEINMRILGLGD